MGGFLEIEATMNDVNQLLKEYAANGSEPAFRELVTRYVDLVYSVALRRLKGDEHRAEEVTQTVFTDLAQKAATLPERVMLGGWLHRHTGFVAGNYVRGEIRRQVREKEAATMMLHESEETNWQEVAPFLDEAIDQLDSSDREAVLLRYFEKRDLRSLGVYLGVSEDAAQKRVSRAVDKLRDLLAERGVTIAAVALGAMLTEQAVLAGPAGLAATVGSKALKGVAVAGASASSLGLTFWGAMKGAVVLLVLATMIGGVVWQRVVGQSEQARPITRAASQIKAEVLKNMNQTVVVAAPLLEAVVSESGTNYLRLKLVAAETGEAVAGTKIKVQRWTGKKLVEGESVVNEKGEVDIAVARGTITKLQLWTQRVGFADTRLLWVPELGDVVPETYTVRLERAVPIGGQVVDREGKPVEDAKVEFLHYISPQLQRSVEIRDVGQITATTDNEGHWEINRIANGTIPQLLGRAWHEALVGTSNQYVSKSTEMENQLREGTYVFRLGAPLITVRGVVVSSEGQPVADAFVIVGELNTQYSHEKRTDADGRFEIAGCRPGKNRLSILTSGFMPFVEDFEFAEESAPVRIVLKPGKALILQVVNRAGEPVAKASFYLDNFTDTGERQLLPTINLEADANGRVEWNQAPDQELTLNVRAAGYMQRHGIKVRPDGKEHQVVLQPPLVIEGTVRDAKSGEPLPKFHILTGWPKKDSSGIQGYRPEWSTIQRFWLDFGGGVFKHSFEGPVVSGKTNPGYMFKFEAEGYASYVTGFVPADAGTVRLDVVLHRVRSHRVMVKLPDGRAAADIDVGLVSPMSKLVINPGGFGDDPDYAAIVHADKTGVFKVTMDDVVQRVAVAHLSGYGEETMATLLNSPTLQIRPWGKVEGVYVHEGKPMSGVLVRLEFKGQIRNGLSLDHATYTMKTDENGCFKFNQVPFGQLTVRLPVPEGVVAKGVYVTRDFEVHPGETTQVRVGDEEIITSEK